MLLSHTASVTILAPVARVFELLTDPAQHHLFDATGMVGAPEAADRLTRVGQVFVMNMTYRSGASVEHYRSDNHVTELAEPRVIEWATATRAGPLLGWCWRFQLEPLGDGDGVTVTLTYDWSGTPEKNVDRFGVPLVDENGLRSSLALLAKASIDQR